MRQAVTVLLAVAFLFTARAEVFLLAEKRDGMRGIAALAKLPGADGPPLLAENVTVNGQALKMEIFALKISWDELIAFLQKRFGIQAGQGSGAIILTLSAGEKKSEKWLFAAGKRSDCVTAFKLDLRGMFMPPEWTDELPPLPDGARANIVMNLPERDAVFGAFDCCPGDRKLQLAKLSPWLQTQNWSPVGAEGAQGIGGSGDLFIRNAPSREIMWVQFGNDGCGAFYRKKLR